MIKSIFKKLIAVIITANVMLFSVNCFSQGAAINTTGISADASAILDVSSTNAGMLIPRMTKNQRNQINLPAEGLLIYQIDDTIGFWYRSSGVWKLMGSGAGSSIANGTATGNTLYWDGSQWVESSNIYNDGGSVGINTNSPDASAVIDISSTTKGTLITRMTTAQRNSIQNPAEGLQIFNLTTKCFEAYISPIWQSIYCGCTPPTSPSAGVNVPQQTEITWNWNSVSGASGYKYNTANNYTTATDIGTNTTYTQSGLTCNTSYTLYVWAYNNCSASNHVILTESTSICCPASFVDVRDSKTYQAVLIGSQCWMKENLNYVTANSLCNAGNATNCNTYGRLYTWDAATGGTSSSTMPSGIQGSCPVGWHLPSDVEWKELEKELGMTQTEADDINYRGTHNESGKIKESGTLHWNSPNTGATNSSGFTGLAGGYCNSSGNCGNIGISANWWTATDDNSNAWSRIIGHDYATVHRGTYNKNGWFAIRCVLD